MEAIPEPRSGPSWWGPGFEVQICLKKWSKEGREKESAGVYLCTTIMNRKSTFTCKITPLKMFWHPTKPGRNVENESD